MQLKIAGKPANVDWVHVLQVGLGAATIVAIQLSRMPSFSADVVSGLALTAMVLGLLYRSIFHQEPPKPTDGIPLREDDDPIVEAKTILRRTMTQFKPNPRWRLFALCVFALLPTCQPPSGTVVAPTIATAVCVLTTVSSDVAAGDTWQQCVADAVSRCGTDVATIATVWASHEKALVTEGFTPPAIKGRTQ
jgi:hypothetical protein